MTRSHNQIKPRDYLVVPAHFGRSPAAVWRQAPAGEELAGAIARVQHEVALAIHSRRDPSAARRMSVQFGFSVKSWSDYTLGKSWLTPAAWAAVATLLLEGQTGSRQGGP